MRDDARGVNVLPSDLSEVASFTFDASHRLLSRRDFNRVFTSPLFRANKGPFRLIASKNEIGRTRIGIVISKRIIARAVDRNRTKRIIRESFRHALPYLPRSIDMIVLLRSFPRIQNQNTTSMLFHALDSLWSSVSLGSLQQLQQ